MIIVADIGLEHTLHGITVLSMVLATIGFCYISYDLLGRPEGILRWLIRVIIPVLLVVLLWSALAFLIPPSISFGSFNLKYVALDFAVYGGVIAMFFGLFTHSSEPVQQLYLPFELPAISVKRLLVWRKIGTPITAIWNTIPVFLKDLLIGIIFASAYWYIETYFVFGYHFYDSNALVSDWLGFALVGAVGGFLWRIVHRPLQVSGGGNPPVFSLSDALIGSLLWSLICLVTYVVMVVAVPLSWRSPLQVRGIVLISSAVTVVAGGLVSGFSRFLMSIVVQSEPLNVFSPLTVIPLNGGVIATCYRLLSRKAKNGVGTSGAHPLYEGIALLFWLVAWLLIWLIVSFVFTISSAITYPFLTLDTVVPWIATGTIVTVLVGTIIVMAMKLLFFTVCKVFAQWKRMPTSAVQAQSASGEVRLEGVSTVASTSTRTRIFYSLLSGLYELAFWYEIWFAFGITLTLHLLLPQIEDITTTLLMGIVITIVSIGALRFILAQVHKVASVGGNVPFFKKMPHLLKFLSWPILFLSFWTISAIIFLDEPLISPLSWRTIALLNNLSLFVGLVAIAITVIIVLMVVSVWSWWTNRPEVSRRTVADRTTFLDGIRESIRRSVTSRNGRPPRFSVRDCFLGLVFWLETWFVCGALIWIASTFQYQLLHGYSPFDWFSLIDPPFMLSKLSGVIGVGFAAMLAGGFTNSFVFWAKHLREKQLGKIGLLFTIVGFLAQLIEPSVLWAQIPPVQGHSDQVIAVAWSPDGERIVSAGNDGMVQIWDVASGKVLLNHSGNSDGVYAVAWEPGKEKPRIAVGSYDKTLQIWNAEDGSLVNSIANNATPTYGVAWAPNAPLIACTGDDGAVFLWDLYKNYTILSSEDRSSPARDISWSSDGKYLAVGYENGKVRIWDASTQKDVFTYGGHSKLVYAVAWEPHGNRIASASADGTVQVWDAFTGKNVFIYSEHHATVEDVAWSHDGTRLASAGEDKTVQVWDTSKNSAVITYRGHFATVNTVAWSPDDKHIASASDDKTVQVWDAFTGDHLFTYAPSV